MSLIGYLEIGDNDEQKYSTSYELTDFKCHVSRHHNESRPDGATWCDRMEVSVVAPGQSDLNLYEWYVDRTLLSGHILIQLSSDDDDGEVKEVLFENALCFALSEEYHIDQDARRTLHLKVVADEVKMDEITLKSDVICQFLQKE